jgi:hypothetical protein
MSNVNTGEKPVHRNPKVSQATLIDLGLVGPKARLKSVVDGQLVNIPVQLIFRSSKMDGKQKLILLKSSLR